MGVERGRARHLQEPLSLWIRETRPPASWNGVRRFGFEVTSRGDRVPGRLLLPDHGPGPFPLILLQHGGGGSKEAPYLDATALPWVRGGAAVASVDFPLHGARRSGKLTRQFLASLARGLREPAAALPEALWREVARQAVTDLRRTLDALESRPEIDAGRVAYAAFSMGSLLGVGFCADDPRPCAATLALGGGGFGPPDLDPARHVGRIAPRPLLLVNATRDEVVPRRAAEALFQAAREPKELRWFESGHSDLPGQALKAMWLFLRPALGLGTDVERSGVRRAPRPAEVAQRGSGGGGG